MLSPKNYVLIICASSFRPFYCPSFFMIFLLVFAGQDETILRSWISVYLFICIFIYTDVLIIYIDKYSKIKSTRMITLSINSVYGRNEKLCFLNNYVMANTLNLCFYNILQITFHALSKCYFKKGNEGNGKYWTDYKRK